MNIHELVAIAAANADAIIGNVYAAVLGGVVLYCLSTLLIGGGWKCDGCDDICDSEEPPTRGTDGHLYCDHCVAFQKEKRQAAMKALP